KPTDFAANISAPPSGWYFKLNRLDKSTWYTPLTGAFEASARPIRYRPESATLIATRQLALQEFERYSVQRSTIAIPQTSQRFMAVMALQEAQMMARALPNTMQ